MDKLSVLKKGSKLSEKALKEASKRLTKKVEKSSSEEEDEKPIQKMSKSSRANFKKGNSSNQKKEDTEPQVMRSPVKTQRSSTVKVKVTLPSESICRIEGF